MNFIPNYFLRNLILNVDIVDFISKYINLKKKGSNYFSLCPFHTEKTPSFVVSNNKQCFHCFGCGTHGNIIDFIIKFNNIDFLKAIDIICNTYCINIPTNYCSKNKINNLNKLNYFYLMEKINNLYHKNINKNKLSIIYLKNRNINLHSINSFNIGYASYNNLLVNYYKNNLNIINKLIKIGLIKKNNDNKLYDFFTNRIIFPIYNKFKKIIGFGGRSLNNKNPKYLNSFNNKYFNKFENLYGLEKIYNYKIYKKILIVEGYFDVIKLHQYGIKNVVGLLGSFISKENIKFLLEKYKYIIFCYDGDKSGYLSSLKLIEIAIPFIKDKYQLKFIKLPINEDPDTYIDKIGKIKFIDKIKKAVPFYKILFMIINDKNIIKNFNNKLKYFSYIKSLLINLPNDSMKAFLIDMLYQKLGIINNEHYNQLFIKTKKNYNNNFIKYTKINIFISLFIQNPYLYKYISKKFLKFQIINNIAIIIIKNIYSLCCKYKNINSSKIIEYFRFSKYNIIIKKLYCFNNMISSNNIVKSFKELNLYLIKLDFKKKLNILLLKIKNNYNINIKNKIYKLTKFLFNN